MNNMGCKARKQMFIKGGADIGRVIDNLIEHGAISVNAVRIQDADGREQGTVFWEVEDVKRA